MRQKPNGANDSANREEQAIRRAWWWAIFAMALLAVGLDLAHVANLG